MRHYYRGWPSFNNYCFGCLRTTKHYADNVDMKAFCSECDREVSLTQAIEKHVPQRGSSFLDELDRSIEEVFNEDDHV